MSADRKAAKQANRDNLERHRELCYRAWFTLTWIKRQPSLLADPPSRRSSCCASTSW